jgi:hypothetical protein
VASSASGASGNDARLRRSVSLQNHQLVEALPPCFMTFANADKRRAIGCNPRVCIADTARRCRFRRDRHRAAPRVHAVEALVRKIAEEDNTRVNHVRGASIFVDSTPGIESRRRDVRALANDDVPSALKWPSFRPVDSSATKAEFAKSDRRRCEQFAGDW